MEGILTEFNSLKNSVHRLKSQLENVEQEVKDQFSSFLEVGFQITLFTILLYKAALSHFVIPIPTCTVKRMGCGNTVLSSCALI